MQHDNASVDKVKTWCIKDGVEELPAPQISLDTFAMS